MVMMYEDIPIGVMIIWEEHGKLTVGKVESNSAYTDGKYVSGRSLKNIWETASNIRIYP